LAVETAFFEQLALLTAPGVGSLENLWLRGEVRVVVLRRGCSYRLRLESILASRGVPAPRVLEFGILEAVFGCVAAGLGITLLPQALIGPVWQSGRVALHSLPPEEERAEIVFRAEAGQLLFKRPRRLSRDHAPARVFLPGG
jgi:DNA-binding transcriptional LysR family regulator